MALVASQQSSQVVFERGASTFHSLRVVTDGGAVFHGNVSTTHGDVGVRRSSDEAPLLLGGAKRIPGLYSVYSVYTFSVFSDPPVLCRWRR